MDFWYSGRIVPLDVLSFWTVCSSNICFADTMSPKAFPPDVLSPDVLTGHRFCSYWKLTDTWADTINYFIFDLVTFRGSQKYRNLNLIKKKILYHWFSWTWRDIPMRFYLGVFHQTTSPGLNRHAWKQFLSLSNIHGVIHYKISKNLLPAIDDSVKSIFSS